MSLVYAGISCHAPGITNRPEKAKSATLSSLKAAFEQQRNDIEAAQPDALLVISAEHFANFFTNNMPTISIGMADFYDGPIEDSDWLGIPKARVPGCKDLTRRLIELVLQRADVGFAEEWQFDHGIMVPLSHVTPTYDTPIIPCNINCQAPPLMPLQRAYEFGRALRTAIDALPERIALLGTGGTSHWPCTPDSGKINAAWDELFLSHWCNHEVAAMTAYTDEDILADAGSGALEIRTSIAVAGAAGGKGNLLFYEPVPVFACGCLIATMSIS